VGEAFALQPQQGLSVLPRMRVGWVQVDSVSIFGSRFILSRCNHQSITEKAGLLSYIPQSS
jgi:hypothetical protein